MAAALIYCTGAARSLYGIAANGYAPQVLLKLNKSGESALTVWINFILAVIIFFFFKNWDQISNLLTCLFAISYGLAPVCMIALRVQLPQRAKPLKLPFGYAWGYIAFFITTLFIYWVGWDTISGVVWFFLFCLIVTIVFQKSSKKPTADIKAEWKASIWLWAYLVVIVIASKLGDYGNGAGVLTGFGSVIFLAICSAFVFWIAAKFTLPSDVIQKQLDNALTSKDNSGH
jgi:amino acid transporter